MFEKKYVFETRFTRIKRLKRKFLFLSSLIIFFFLSLCIYIPYYSQTQTDIAQAAIFEKAPDLIIVYTGGYGRVTYAVEMAKNFPSAKLFISGVYSKNNLKTILEKSNQSDTEDLLLERDYQIELDYFSQNTIENGLSTLNYLRKNPQFQRVLIITSDYHVLRSDFILNTLGKEELKNVEVFLHGIKSSYTDLNNIKLLLKEVYKLVTTSTFLIFWDKEMNIH
jgi:uncharacterized SAM-binding protein YcdF (DUF218 family)